MWMRALAGVTTAFLFVYFARLLWIGWLKGFLTKEGIIEDEDKSESK